MNKDLEKIIFDEKQIDNIISNVSSKINNDYKNKEPLFIGLLKGAIPFMTDLVKKINLKLRFLHIVDLNQQEILK